MGGTVVSSASTDYEYQRELRLLRYPKDGVAIELIAFLHCSCGDVSDGTAAENRGVLALAPTLGASDAAVRDPWCHGRLDHQLRWEWTDLR